MLVSIRDTVRFSEIDTLIDVGSTKQTIRKFEQDTLVLLMKGSLQLDGPGCNCELHSESIMFIRHGTYMWIEKPNFDDQYKAVEIALSNSFLETFQNRYASSMPTCLDTGCDLGNCLVVFITDNFIRQSALSLCELYECSHPEPLKNHKVEEILLQLLHSENGYKLISVLRQVSLKPSERLHVFMEHHFLKNWKLDRFANEFGACLTTFKDLFNDVYGVAPRAWINDRRLLLALDLLRSSNKSIIEIALETGFSSQSYFAQAFRRRFGLSPSQARKLGYQHQP